MNNSKNHSINLKNIDYLYFFNLQKDFRLELFQKCLNNTGSWTALAKKADYSPERLRSIKNGKCIGKEKKAEKVLLNKVLIIKLSKISGIKIEEIEKNIIEIRKGNNGKAIPIKLPIQTSKYLASVIANSLGDGSLRTNYFTYGNTEITLVNNLIACIDKIFNCNVPYKLTKKKMFDKDFYILVYPGTVSNILSLFGSVVGNKLKKDFDVPNWIKYGDKEIKSSFIRSLFDDESHVSKRDKNIVISFSKDIQLEDSLVQFLSSIVDILKDLGINANKIKKLGNYSTSKGERRTQYGFAISGKDELIKYKEEIRFNHPKKVFDLDILLNSYKLIIYKPNVVYEKIIKFLSKCPKSTQEISFYINRNLETARLHLNLLFRKGKIKKEKKGHTIWSIGG